MREGRRGIRAKEFGNGLFPRNRLEGWIANLETPGLDHRSRSRQQRSPYSLDGGRLTGSSVSGVLKVSEPAKLT